MCSLSLADLMDVLRLCPCLQKCTGSSGRTRTPNVMVAPTAKVHHTAITHLELSKESYSLLRHITIPSLTVLCVSGICNIQLEHLIHFIARSQCSIQELDFSPTGTSLNYDAFLESLTSLTRFTLRLKNITQLNEFQPAVTP